MKRIWDIWKYSLGSFSDDKTPPYDNYVYHAPVFLLVMDERFHRIWCHTALEWL